MLSSDRNIEAILRLVQGTRRYGELRFEQFERNTVDRLTALLTALIMGAIIFVVGIVVVVFLSAAIVVALSSRVGLLASLLIVGGFYAVVLALLWARRHAIIARPIKAALAQSFFAEKADSPAPTEEVINEAATDISNGWNTLTAPPSPARNRFEQAFNTASRAWTIADGILLGYKLYRRFGCTFGRKKRNGRK